MTAILAGRATNEDIISALAHHDTVGVAIGSNGAMVRQDLAAVMVVDGMGSQFLRQGGGGD
jgi:hypothetical protein